MSLTPLFYSPKQVADHAFISIQKLPAFVEGAKRQTIEPIPLKEDDFALAHEVCYVQKILNLKIHRIILFIKVFSNWKIFFNKVLIQKQWLLFVNIYYNKDFILIYKWLQILLLLYIY